MNAKVRRQLRKRNQRIRQRIDKCEGIFQSPAIRPTATKFELSERTQAISCGGIGLIMQIVKQLDLRKHINEAASVFKMNLPYDEADHVFNIAMNLLAGGTCLEHIELRRTDEAYLNALGAQRIPDPTTAGDFCRRFDSFKIMQLMQGINRARLKVWKQQPDEFLDQATIEADGTMVETYGEKKQGIGINHKGQWGYHPLVITLAETQELLYLANRSGNRPSHENSAMYFNSAIELCKEAGFRKIRLRGDTDFSSTTHLDHWDREGVTFVLGYDANKTLVGIADLLPQSAWNTLSRQRPMPENGRAKRPNYKERIVVANEYENQILQGESYAEFDYQPVACNRKYRMVIVRKDIKVMRGQQHLFDTQKYFFYITNEQEKEVSAREVIRNGNQRCDQENTISQGKACGALSAPLDTLESNWAYMVMASLAWTLKLWSGMLVRVKGNPNQRRVRAEVRRKVIRMEFSTYLNSLMLIPAQVIRSARQLKLRLLAYRPSVDCLLTLSDHIAMPLRC
ncbi:IS1380 family transposase [Aporhodopirellula aestuarii]|uniref:IS1380 family transposase n=1 Tax=Aporhodopirellula aestuarii TaxID=2950107 RepID=A0ABT0U5T7_9BACT|nr:IS1380 family transposase [Aporhodopirellula aestuarii]MCM2372307.1 IS1380 family transposase [Aporhodopirellula aestuarii]